MIPSKAVKVDFDRIIIQIKTRQVVVWYIVINIFFYDLLNVQACSKTSTCIFILQVRRDQLTCCCHVVQNWSCSTNGVYTIIMYIRGMQVHFWNMWQQHQSVTYVFIKITMARNLQKKTENHKHILKANRNYSAILATLPITS